MSPSKTETGLMNYLLEEVRNISQIEGVFLEYFEALSNDDSDNDGVIFENESQQDDEGYSYQLQFGLHQVSSIAEGLMGYTLLIDGFIKTSYPNSNPDVYISKVNGFGSADAEKKLEAVISRALENGSGGSASLTKVIRSLKFAAEKLKFLSVAAITGNAGKNKSGETENLDSLSKESTEDHSTRYSSQFEELQFIGSGGFGAVVKVRQYSGGGIYAIKCIPLLREEKESSLTEEASMLAKLNHKHIVRYYDAWIEEFGKLNEGSGVVEIPFTENPLEFFSSRLSESLNRKWNLRDIFPQVSFGNDARRACIQKWGTRRFSRLKNDSKLNRREFSTDSSTMKRNSSRRMLRSASYDINISNGKANSPNANGKIVGAGAGDTANNLPIHLWAQSRGIASLSNRCLYILMEYCPGRSLREAIDSGNLYADKLQILKLSRQILEALTYMHHMGVIHRDLKPSNIFLASGEESLYVKIGDFGLTTSVSNMVSSQYLKMSHSGIHTKEADKLSAGVGTIYYMAPELETGGLYDQKVDMFSFGVIFFELWHPPFLTAMERACVLNNLLRNQRFPPFFENSVEFEVISIIKNLLFSPPEQRFSAASLLTNSFLQRNTESGSRKVYEVIYRRPFSMESIQLMATLFSRYENARTTDEYLSSQASYDRFVCLVKTEMKRILREVFHRRGAIQYGSPVLLPRTILSHFFINSRDLLPKISVESSAGNAGKRRSLRQNKSLSGNSSTQSSHQTALPANGSKSSYQTGNPSFSTTPNASTPGNPLPNIPTLNFSSLHHTAAPSFALSQASAGFSLHPHQPLAQSSSFATSSLHSANTTANSEKVDLSMSNSCGCNTYGCGPLCNHEVVTLIDSSGAPLFLLYQHLHGFAQSAPFLNGSCVYRRWSFGPTYRQKFAKYSVNSELGKGLPNLGSQVPIQLHSCIYDIVVPLDNILPFDDMRDSTQDEILALFDAELIATAVDAIRPFLSHIGRVQLKWTHVELLPLILEEICKIPTEEQIRELDLWIRRSKLPFSKLNIYKKLTQFTSLPTSMIDYAVDILFNIIELGSQTLTMEEYMNHLSTECGFFFSKPGGAGSPPSTSAHPTDIPSKGASSTGGSAAYSSNPSFPHTSNSSADASSSGKFEENYCNSSNFAASNSNAYNITSSGGCSAASSQNQGGGGSSSTNPQPGGPPPSPKFSSQKRHIEESGSFRHAMLLRDMPLSESSRLKRLIWILHLMRASMENLEESLIQFQFSLTLDYHDEVFSKGTAFYMLIDSAYQKHFEILVMGGRYDRLIHRLNRIWPSANRISAFCFEIAAEKIISKFSKGSEKLYRGFPSPSSFPGSLLYPPAGHLGQQTASSLSKQMSPIGFYFPKIFITVNRIELNSAAFKLWVSLTKRGIQSEKSILYGAGDVQKIKKQLKRNEPHLVNVEWLVHIKGVVQGRSKERARSLSASKVDLVQPVITDLHYKLEGRYDAAEKIFSNEEDVLEFLVARITV